MKREAIVAGNWKMNKNYPEGRELAKKIVELLQPSEVKVILCPPFIHLNQIGNIINGISNLSLGGQNCHQEQSGAYTGEVSAGMLRSVGADYVILGHSERREYFDESDGLLAQKTDQALSSGLKPIFCCGEKLDVREAGEQEKVVAHQLKEGLFHLEAAQLKQVVIAYEPVWAIGTGETATPDQAQDMHRFIRDLIAENYGQEVAGSIPILYGGSVKPNNAAEIFSKADVDGGLIGGASLKTEDFIAIVNAMKG